MITEKNEGKIHQTHLQIFLRFLRFGFLAFGGPVAQIGMLKQELVEDEQWVSREEFNRALAVYQILPGPEAHEMCVWFGMIAGGRLGGFLAGLGFMLPGFLLMLGLTWFYFTYGIGNPILNWIFMGFNVAVIALIFNAIKRIGQHSISSKGLFVIAILSAMVTFLGTSFIISLSILGLAYSFFTNHQKVIAVILGILLICYGSFIYFQQKVHVQPDDTTIAVTDTAPATVFVTGLKAGLLTFGGAYTSIPFVEKDAVRKFNWLSEEQFLDGLALSGILPAPLIIFSVFVGYAASGLLGAILITIGIFLPAFCFTLFGHKFFQRVIENKSLHSFLDGVTAAVIGIISVTALKLFVTTITDWVSILLFISSLLVLIKVKSRFSPLYVIILSGAVMLIFKSLA